MTLPPEDELDVLEHEFKRLRRQVREIDDARPSQIVNEHQVARRRAALIEQAAQVDTEMRELRAVLQEDETA